jgi:hypothetical protein
MDGWMSGWMGIYFTEYIFLFLTFLKLVYILESMASLCGVTVILAIIFLS